MARKYWRTELPGPSHLARVLQNLRREPRPALPRLRALRLTLASRNDHFAARHFVKEELPRIRYANPRLEISVEKKVKKEGEAWPATIELAYADGATETHALTESLSTDILTRVLDAGAGDGWKRWKETRAAQGLPPLDPPVVLPPPPQKTKYGRPALTLTQKPAKKVLGAEEVVEAEGSSPAKPDFTKTGAAMVLP
ncbi:hypothetical protein PENSPDRAFT_642954 [Peniophora sp. CONT]|nr:hypothetical protein PENSPDRAFT_642954 [Peniophora sp. CONT]